MKKNRWFLRALALMLCVLLLFPTLLGSVTAYADDEEEEEEDLWVPTAPMDYGILNPAELTKLVDDYCKAWGLNKSKISVGYCYLDTGDTWYYNADTWYYSADLYKVPLTMILASWEAEGSINQDTVLTKDLTLAQLENYILCYNSNDYAHDVMNLAGGPEESREEYQKFSNLPQEYYSRDFGKYSYFTVRFMTDVIKNLYYHQDNFPRIMEWLKGANQWEYFHAGIGGQYEVAQKYGTFIDKRNIAYNHCTGIVFCDHPFALTVMTQEMGVSQSILKDMAMSFKNYTLSLNDAYASWAAEGNTPDPNKTSMVYEPVSSKPVSAPAATPAPTPAETPAPVENTDPEPTETPDEPQTESPAAETPAQPAQPAEDDSPAEEQPAQTQEAAQPVQPAEGSSARMVVIILGLAVCAILALGWIVSTIKRGKNPGRH